MSGTELVAVDSDAAVAFQNAASDQVRSLMESSCVTDWSKHQSSDSTNTKFVDVELTIESRAGNARVASVDRVKDKGPEGVGQELHDCIRDAFSVVVFQSDHDFRYHVVYPLCFQPRAPASAKPVCRAYLDGEPGMRAGEMFDEEPRWDAWAHDREREILAAAQADDLSGQSVECRCRTCRLVASAGDLESANRFLAGLSKRMVELLPGATRVNMSSIRPAEVPSGIYIHTFVIYDEVE